MTIQQVQATIETISENIADMTATELRIADANGWQDARIDRIEADIEQAQGVRDALVAQLQAMRAQAKAKKGTAA